MNMKKGFSLLETLVALGVLSLALSGALTLVGTIIYYILTTSAGYQYNYPYDINNF